MNLDIKDPEFLRDIVCGKIQSLQYDIFWWRTYVDSFGQKVAPKKIQEYETQLQKTCILLEEINSQTKGNQ